MSRPSKFGVMAALVAALALASPALAADPPHRDGGHDHGSSMGGSIGSGYRHNGGAGGSVPHGAYRHGGSPGGHPDGIGFQHDRGTGGGHRGMPARDFRGTHPNVQGAPPHERGHRSVYPSPHAGFGLSGRHIGHFHGHSFGEFTPYERHAWEHGSWRHAWHDGHWGWWWFVDGLWFFYPVPVYPYPSYVGPTYYYDYNDDDGAPPYYWYYCQDPPGYYPYVQDCNVPWQPVPPTPYDQGDPGDDDGQ